MPSVIEQMKADPVFTEQLSACENWPKHAYMFRPRGLMTALFLLSDIANGAELPPEIELRKACALVYADHLRLEGHYFATEEAQQKITKKWTDEIRKEMKKRAESEPVKEPKR